MTTKTKLVITERIKGLGDLARELGVSKHHLCAVLHGRRRPGPELAAAIKARGIKREKLRPIGERWE